MITVSLGRDMIINANISYHRQVKATKARNLCNQAYWIAKASKETYDGPVDLAIEIAFPPIKQRGTRRHDRLNLAGTIKHLVDGMVDAGVLLDDNDKIIRSEHLTTADQPCEDCYGAVITFTFTPVGEAA